MFLKKHLTICILIFSIISTMLSVSASSDKVVFDITVPQTLPKAGEAFEVTVDVSNNPGFCAIQFVLNYDSSLMKCEYADMAERMSGTLSATNAEAV